MARYATVFGNDRILHQRKRRLTDGHLSRLAAALHAAGRVHRIAPAFVIELFTSITCPLCDRQLCTMRILLLLTQGFLALNAMAGGILLMVAPDGSMLQLPSDFMHSTLFADYFWPGAVLFGVLGVGHLVGFVLTVRRSPITARAALILGTGTLIWIGVQVLLTELFWLQGLIASLGLVELVAGFRLTRS